MWTRISRLFQPILKSTPYCFAGGLVAFERQKWEEMSFTDLCAYLTSNFHVTQQQFGDKAELIDFFECFEGCVHKDKELMKISESVANEREWINKFIEHGQRTKSDTFIDECRNITRKQNDLKQEYGKQNVDPNATAISIDDSYWDMYRLLQIPNSSMACSQNIIFVLFHTLKDILNDLANDNKYENTVQHSFLESKSDDNLDVLDCGCGVGMIGRSIAHFYPYFARDCEVIKERFGDKLSLNLYGFDHSINALKYGESKAYFEHYDEIFLGDINDKEFVDEELSPDGRLYDMIIASDMLFQSPINGIVGIDAIKTCFSLLKPGGFLIAGSPIQHSTPCLNDAYNKALQPYLKQNNIRCILYDEVVKAEADIAIDETYILIKMYYKQPEI
eukprot:665886_1